MAERKIVEQTLAEIGATTPESAASLFAEVGQGFDKQATVHSADPESWRVFVLAWTGRKSGVLSLITDNWLKPAPPELKRVVGQELNKLKAHVEAVLEERRVAIEAAAEQAAQAREQIDLSLPGVERAIGTRHLIRQTYEELQRIFLSIGFSVVEGPEIETPYYNFEALNIPEHHPARDNMDTFYIEGARGGHLLRTHTSPMQIRTMESLPARQSRRYARVHVSPDRRAGRRYRHYLLRFQGHCRIFRARVSWAAGEDAASAQLFPVHRAFRGSRCHLPRLRRERVPRLQIFGLD
jgi:hypothetical protein